MIHSKHSMVDYPPDQVRGLITLRRVQMIQERQEYIYLSLYVTVMAVFVALLIALYKVRRDLLEGLSFHPK